ncbi:MAG: hypothetical protein LBT00_16275 [Spirochaetaceae bacterium]|nr:hypothetical protein [Spirochaetaceae bacterium]
MRTRRVKQSRRGGLSTGLLRSAMCRSLAMTDGDGFCLEIGCRWGEPHQTARLFGRVLFSERAPRHCEPAG